MTLKHLNTWKTRAKTAVNRTVENDLNAAAVLETAFERKKGVHVAILCPAVCEIWLLTLVLNAVPVVDANILPRY